jgi:hypothetical protein
VHDGGVTRLVRMLWRTRCPRNGDASTVGVAAAMAHPSSGSMCGGRAVACDDVQRWRRCSDDEWHWWHGPAVPEEKGEGEAHAN